MLILWIYIVGILSVHLHIGTRHVSLTGFELFLVIFEICILYPYNKQIMYFKCNIFS